MKHWRWLGSLAVFVLAASASAQSRDITVDTMRGEKRVALVIGNSAYRISPLKNPTHDARAMARTLRELGFDVLVRENVGQKDMRKAIIEFGERLRDGGVGLFFFAGHGLQVGGKNYMVPIDADIKSESEVEVESVDVASVLSRMDTAQNRLNIVVLDACRDNPFGRSFRSSARGLASIDAPSGTIIAYATAPGRVAADGDGANGLYTGELVKAMRLPGLKVEDVFKRVRQSVQERSRRQQVPWESSSLVGDFMFMLPPNAIAARPAPGPVAAIPQESPREVTVRVIPRLGSLIVRSAGESVEVWLGERQIGEVGPGSELLVENLQAGAHIVRAKARRDGFKPWEQTVQIAGNQRAEIAIDIERLGPPSVLKTEDGNEMVLVSAGEFWMGSEDSEDEKPRHRVHLDAFYIDKYEVTNALYGRFMLATSRSAPSYWSDSRWNDASQPVVGVSWHDVDAYCRWAAKRLPTEAEWEKAARGPDGRRYPWGDEWDTSRANSDESHNGVTVAVGSYPTGVSPYGAHDMAGNVWEWVADWYAEDYYQHSPERNPDGPGSGKYRTLRGGSWRNDLSMRSAYRGTGSPGHRGPDVGFRCAKNPPL